METTTRLTIVGAYIGTFLAGSFPAAADTPPGVAPLPALRAFPSGLKDAKNQTPLASSATTVPPVVVSPALPIPPLDTAGFQVKICERVPNLPGGRLMDALGYSHQWLVVQDRFGNTVHSSGLGNANGIPGANGQVSPDYFFSKTFSRNHEGETGRTCKPSPLADPLCVILKTPYNQYQGRWFPFSHDCNTFAQRTVSACQMSNLSASTFLNKPPVTVWDKIGLMPKSDTGAKYRLLDTDLKKTVRIPSSQPITPPKTKSR